MVKKKETIKFYQHYYWCEHGGYQASPVTTQCWDDYEYTLKDDYFRIQLESKIVNEIEDKKVSLLTLYKEKSYRDSKDK